MFLTESQSGYQLQVWKKTTLRFLMGSNHEFIFLLFCPRLKYIVDRSLDVILTTQMMTFAPNINEEKRTVQ